MVLMMICVMMYQCMRQMKVLIVVSLLLVQARVARL